jgi:predicted nucleic acid-binding protein
MYLAIRILPYCSGTQGDNVAKTVYFDTSVFLEMGAKRSKIAKEIRALLKELEEERVRIYTSIITVQEVSVASYRQGAVGKDTYGDIQAFARIYEITKDVALTAAHREAELKDIAAAQEAKRPKNKPETEEQKLDRICVNRRRKWDCFHIATAQSVGCSIIYSTDEGMQRKPAQLGIKGLRIIPPKPTEPTISGPLFSS